MKNLFVHLFICCSAMLSLSAGEFTVATYNCGGLSEHYDYIRAACMQKLMQERYNKEPLEMATVEKIQEVALKMMFAKSKGERLSAKQVWKDKEYDKLLSKLTSPPIDAKSVNYSWHELSEEMVSSYKVRPIELRDKAVKQQLIDQVQDITRGSGEFSQLLDQSYRVMAQRAILNHLKYDILCFQEADFITMEMFPDEYEAAFSEAEHSINGVAWNTNRFALVAAIGNIKGRGYAVALKDRANGKTITVASGHLSGCNPFKAVSDPKTREKDSVKGDEELKTIATVMQEFPADFAVIGMDSNVTATHPRLTILRDLAYQIDADNFLEMTCTNPYQILNTRLDWVALKTSDKKAAITNIPVMGIGLNSIQTNVSDHKPVAARITYPD